MRKIPTNLLNKSEAASFLHNEYWNYISVNGYADQHPNFASLINENLRDANSPSALKSGIPRGNTRLYGHINSTRIDHQPMYHRADLRNFFETIYEPSMKKVSLTKAAA
jgi:hypothetical protein